MTTLTTIVPDPAPPVTLLETAPVSEPLAGTQLISTLGWNNLIILLEGTSVDEIDMDALEALTVNRALVTDVGGHIIVSPVTNTELALLSGVTILGDMVLASAQTNTGIKTFLDTTMKLRNVANTFDAFFVNTVTADRIITIPDAAGTMIITGLANQITNIELTAGAFAKITGVGTIASGTWEATPVASAFLDADTMHLSVAQTVNGAKTFLDTNLLLRNVANTFNGSFVNTNTADRIYTLPDVAGTVSLIAATETLLNKTLTTPTIVATGFTNMQHTHQAANTGGQLVATLALTATGTKDSTTFLRGDDTWAVPTGGSQTPWLQNIDGAGFTLDCNTGSIINIVETTYNKTVGSVTIGVDLATDGLLIQNTTGMVIEKEDGASGELFELVGYGAQYQMRQNRANGTKAAPTAVLTGEVLGANQFSGWDGTAFVRGSMMRVLTTEDWNGTSRGAELSFFTVDNTTTTLDERVKIQNDGDFNLLTNNLVNVGTIEINNPADTFQYIITSAAIAANRILNLPLMTGTDTLVLNDFAATLTNKTLTTPTIASFVNATHNHSNAAGGGNLTNTALTSGVFTAITGVGVQTQALDMNANNIEDVDILEFSPNPDHTISNNAATMFFDVGAGDSYRFEVANSPILEIFSTHVLIAVPIRLTTGMEISAQSDDMIFDVSTGNFFSFDVNGVPEFTFDAAAFTLSDANDIAVGTTTGTKIGTATTQKIGFWNATPVVQPAHIADPSGGATVDAEARTAIDAILVQMATTGMQAAS